MTKVENSHVEVATDRAEFELKVAETPEAPRRALRRLERRRASSAVSC
jgi:hypothetical protein